MNWTQPIKYKMLLPLAVCGIVLSGCLREDNDYCPTDERFPVAIHLSYEHNKEYQDLLPSVVETVKFYSYDVKTKALVDATECTAAELAANDYAATVNLPNGSYHIVAWMNAPDTDYNINYQTDYNAAYVENLTVNDNEVQAGFSSVYHGKTKVSFSKKSTNREAVIKMIKNTHHINVYCIFPDVIPPTVSFECYITGSNGIYDFENYPVWPSPVLKYIPTETLTYAGQTNLYAFDLQRMWEGDDLELFLVKKEVAQPDEILINSFEVTTAVMSYPQYNSDVELDRYDTYNFTFEISVTGGEYSVTGVYIEDWLYTEQSSALE